MEPKDVLVRQIGDLLGFEDGAEDMLDHVLTIDSSEELLDYMNQLLGSSDEKLKDFVENVRKFHANEPLMGAASPPSPISAAPSSATQVREEPARKPGKINNGKPAAAPLSKDLPQARNPPAPIGTDDDKKQAPPEPAPTDMSTKSKDPLKGKASVVCGCFGSKHKALANCLYCGRISCEKEGYDFCAFCGYMVEEVKPPSNLEPEQVKAWKHKERLLQYDREFAQRTVIYDDQADYYTRHQSNWLDEDQRQEAKDQEEERQRQIHARPKLQLSLDL